MRSATPISNSSAHTIDWSILYNRATLRHLLHSTPHPTPSNSRHRHLHLSSIGTQDISEHAASQSLELPDDITWRALAARVRARQAMAQPEPAHGPSTGAHPVLPQDDPAAWAMLAQAEQVAVEVGQYDQARQAAARAARLYTAKADLRQSKAVYDSLPAHWRSRQAPRVTLEAP